MRSSLALVLALLACKSSKQPVPAPDPRAVKNALAAAGPSYELMKKLRAQLGAQFPACTAPLDRTLFRLTSSRLMELTGEPVDERGHLLPKAEHGETIHGLDPEMSMRDPQGKKIDIGFADCSPDMFLCAWDTHNELPPPAGTLDNVYPDRVAKAHAEIQSATGFLVAAIDEYVPPTMHGGGSGFVMGHVTGRVIWFGKDAAGKCQVPFAAESSSSLLVGGRRSDNDLESNLNVQTGHAILEALAK